MTTFRRGQLLRTPFAEDIPRAFSKDPKEHSYFAGPYIEVIFNFAMYHKLNLKLEFKDKIANSEILTGIQSGRYNISLLGGVYATDIESMQYSYPIGESINCIMVPLEDELPKYYYVIWPFGRWIWLSMILGVFYIAYLLHLLKRSSRGITVQSYTQYLLQSMAILLYSPNLNVQLNGATVRTMAVYILLFLLGFVLSNFHICYMTTYCMKPVFVPPINSIDELVKAKIPVLVTESVFEQIRNSGIFRSTRLESISVIVNSSEFQRVLKSRDRSFAYVMAQDQWDYLNRQQQDLKKPYFHLSQICFNKTYLGFPMHAEPKFTKAFDTFMFRIHQAGLWKQWENDAFMLAIQAGYTDIMRDAYPVESLNLQFFWIAWLVLFIGLSASCGVVFLEFCVWHRNPRFKCRLNVAIRPQLEDEIQILE